jgi:hypothetical protein
MTPSPFRLTLVALLLAASSIATAQDCKGLQDLPPYAQQFKDDQEQTDCGSFMSVLYRLFNTSKTGGRKLEEDRPFNAQAAQADLAKAQADPEVRPRLEKIRQQIADPTRRLVYEAAVLDEEGYYSARDLRINQLKQQLK